MGAIDESAPSHGQMIDFDTSLNEVSFSDSRTQFMNTAERGLCASIFAVTALLAACGGGGDSGSVAPIQTAPSLAITTANRDLVSHDAVAGVMALSSTTSIPLGSPASLADRATAQGSGAALSSSWSGRIAGAMLGHLRAAMPAAGRPHALAVIGPVTEACLVSGSTTTTAEDRDNDGTLSAGDAGTVVFNHCRDTATETINGTASVVFSALENTYFAAHMTASGMATVTTGHSLTIDGSMLMEVWTPDAVATTIRTTAEGPVRATISTHVPFADTVTLESGFAIEERIDISVVAPVAGGAPGRTLTTLVGRMSSTAANGTFDVATVESAPMTRYHADDYPSAGIVRVTGRSGVLVLTTTSVSAVLLDLDWNDDGRYETSELKAWDWLI